jgi:hypothetical protein
MADPLRRKPEAGAAAKAAKSSKQMVEWTFESPNIPKPAEPRPAEKRPRSRARVRVLAGVATVVLVAGAAVGTLKLTGSTSPQGDAAHSSPLMLLGLPTYTSESPSPTVAKKVSAKAVVSKAVVRAVSSSPASATTAASSALTSRETAALANSAASGQSMALVKNGSGSAYAFALSSAHTLLYAHQSSTGPGGWTDFATVPGSPTDLVSEPAAAVDKDGGVEVFARDADGDLVDGSQTSSGFSWDDSAGGSPPDTPAGDPTTVLQPDGDISLFIRLGDGQVAESSQKSPNGGGWTAWSSLGGNISGDPVAYTDPDGLVDLFAVSSSGALVADIEAYGAFMGWNTLGSSPDDLVDTPLPLPNQNGKTEVFVTTSAGSMDSVWGTGGSTSWTWGAPLTADELGSGIAGSPSGYAWSTDGHLEIFARLANGDLAHAWQNEPNGETDWSLWGTLPASPSGDPTAFMNADGSPEVLMLSPYHEIEFDYWMTSTSAWSAPIVMPGDI